MFKMVVKLKLTKLRVLLACRDGVYNWIGMERCGWLRPTKIIKHHAFIFLNRCTSLTQLTYLKFDRLKVKFKLKN